MAAKEKNSNEAEGVSPIHIELTKTHVLRMCACIGNSG